MFGVLATNGDRRLKSSESTNVGGGQGIVVVEVGVVVVVVDGVVVVGVVGVVVVSIMTPPRPFEHVEGLILRFDASKPTQTIATKRLTSNPEPARY